MLLIAAALLCSVLATLFALNPVNRDAWVLALFGLMAMLFAWVNSLFGIRLEPESIRYGLWCRKRLAYAEIVELVRASTGRDAVLYLVLRSGRRTRLGTDLACEALLVEELQRRSGCRVTRQDASRRGSRHV